MAQSRFHALSSMSGERGVGEDCCRSEWRALPRDDRKSPAEKAFGRKDDARSVVGKPFDRTWRQGRRQQDASASHFGGDDLAHVRERTDVKARRREGARSSGLHWRLLRRVRELHAGAQWNLSNMRDRRSDDRMAPDVIGLRVFLSHKRDSHNMDYGTCRQFHECCNLVRSVPTHPLPFVRTKLVRQCQYLTLK